MGDDGQQARANEPKTASEMESEDAGQWETLEK